MTIILLTIVGTILATLLILNLLPGEKKIEHRIAHLYSVESPQFIRSMGNLLGPPLVDGNKVTILKNGIEIFPSMLSAIQGAKRTICFETYIYWSGDIGRTFAEALAERARNGVKVHVILDWVGSLKMDETLLNIMKDAGVEIVKYHPIHWYTLSRVNNRTHRKLLVVDGAVAFTGGVGIADEWKGDADSPNHWRDTHFRLEGPAVAHMQSAFMDNWTKTNSEVLHGEEYFPALSSRGDHLGQVFTSSADEGSESARLMYLLSIASASRSIKVAASYFVPDELSIRTLLEARARGVSVDIILPGPFMDVRKVQKASRAKWGALLEGGVRIYEYQPTMYHCKIMIIDGIWSTVGSTNFDNRSLRLNDEANLNILSREFAEVLNTHFEEDRARSVQITYEMWRNRSLQERAEEKFWSLFQSQL